ncbi:MAG: BatA domain-containing protein [Clostridiales bacterium]|jgi:hypothetical protein|nr:BatA domain-containing protein [Eubacteriales bacterium]MDH7567604.1 BatA domain-containing protein [Clostridiales bacterium]
MTFYSPWSLLFLLTVPAIIALYLLKQRHREHTVSSLYLWQEVLKDMEVRSPWQKLKRNILMLLQIAATILLSLALSRPFLDTPFGKAGNVIVVMDTSMSMQASDVAPSRLEAAKRQAAGLISDLPPGTLVTLISMGGSAVIEENLSSDRSRVLDRLKGLKATYGTADREDAASLIQSMVKQYPGTQVVLFGDEALDSPGIDVKFSKLSGNGANYAVTLLSHTRSKNGISVLSRIANFSPAEEVLPVSLYADGRVFDAKNVRVKPRETVNVYWDSIPENSRQLECSIDRKDSLDADNTAWDAVNPVKSARVMLVSEKNVFIEKAAALVNSIQLFKTDFPGADNLKGYDLYIFDGYLPEKLPSDGNIMIFNPPANSLFTVSGEVELPHVEKSRHELLAYVNDYSFVVGRMKKMAVPRWAETVLNSREGPVIFAGSPDNRRIAVFGFDLHNTDMALKPVFPIMMTNFFEWLIPSEVKNIESLYPGQSIDFNLNPKAEEARVITPGGESVPVAPPFPAVAFTRTEGIGQYLLEQKTPEGKSYHYFSVNAPSERESNLASDGAASPAGAQAAVSAGNVADSGFSLQSILLCLVLLLLLIEWWVYSYGF